MNKQIKKYLNKKKAILTALALSTSLALTSCQQNTNQLWRNGICYDDDGNLLSGSISYSDLDKLHILTFKKDDNLFVRLVAKLYTPKYNTVGLYDVESGVLLAYKNRDHYDGINYEGIEFISEDNISKYLLKGENFKQEYDINEILDVYNDVKKEKLKKLGIEDSEVQNKELTITK